MQLLSEQRSLADIERGDVEQAIDKCRNIWASLPGAGYGQREHRLDKLVAVYRAAGGTLTP